MNPLKEVAIAWAEGKVIQSKGRYDGEWHDAHAKTVWLSDELEWRIKPQPPSPAELLRLASLNVYAVHKSSDYFTLSKAQQEVYTKMAEKFINLLKENGYALS